jgi:hypothetical protein
MYAAANGKGCNNYVLIIHDKEAYPNDPDVQLDANFLQQQRQQQSTQPQQGEEAGWKFIPDVFLSGSVHGNERVGPLESASCESLPRMKLKPSSNTDGGADNNGQDDDAESATGVVGDAKSNGDEQTIINNTKFTQEQWNQELSTALNCRQYLADRGIPSPLRQWLARLVSTRRTVIIPTANALGYSRNQRAEGTMDPNRDFPFDKYHESECMRTIAGRSINELWRSHLFQIGLTFHGGMEVIGYEWGAPTYFNLDAPDAVAQEQIAQEYSQYSNGFPGHVPYDYGTMNDKVYYVRGGMEDLGICWIVGSGSGGTMYSYNVWGVSA